MTKLKYEAIFDLSEANLSFSLFLFDIDKKII